VGLCKGQLPIEYFRSILCGSGWGEWSLLSGRGKSRGTEGQGRLLREGGIGSRHGRIGVKVLPKMRLGGLTGFSELRIQLGRREEREKGPSPGDGCIHPEQPSSGWPAIPAECPCLSANSSQFPGASI
jgi:hypothetical protein